MQMNKLWIAATLGAALALAGCGAVPRSTGAMKIGPDTYQILARASLAGAGQSQKMAFDEANEYCGTMGREMMTIGAQANEYAGYQVTFRCLNSGDPELKRPNLETRPDVVIQDRR